jgi:hypothetical protein
VRLVLRLHARFVDLDHEVAVVARWERCEDCVEVDDAEAGLGPEPLGAGQLVIAALVGGIETTVEEVGEAVLDVDAADPVGVARDEGRGVDPGPPQVARVRTNADDVGSQVVEQPDDLRLGLEDAADVGVVQWADSSGLKRRTSPPDALDGAGQSCLVEVGTHRRARYPSRYRHRRHHGAVHPERRLVVGEPLDRLELVGCVDRLVER